ncbi:Uncharacterised protein [Serratia quinivorans]|jgi:hypothetical protein|uniref:hypothetical protein n=1 Tax=Serratia quinivorans TaxID=137545 RepID=UPI002177F18A|nr:hypothetical protein [Serratia quinivorans]CAI0753271.1 Uncharacterised protein [Serratia quinivorans]CAI0860337.1 Uncharacterised protein [Serratia quinivorans]CAI0876433.1 Uncharacterised protein [Serratia quinivorans]CAI1666464.1 Uncharacterised protein [Serratia quinivorans]CAI2046103.1 Uncharacterised protein [Serratia quinivorans]
MTANNPYAMASAPHHATQWLAIANVVFADIAVALHVGKATIALPKLQREFSRSLALAIPKSDQPIVNHYTMYKIK